MWILRKLDSLKTLITFGVECLSSGCLLNWSIQLNVCIVRETWKFEYLWPFPRFYSLYQRFDKVRLLSHSDDNAIL